MKVLEDIMKATQMPQLGGWGRTAMKIEFPTEMMEGWSSFQYFNTY
jgi:hypothetical protein